MSEPILKLPLRVRHSCYIDDGDGMRVAEAWATTNSLSQSRAHEIVRRVNAFDALLAACKAATNGGLQCSDTLREVENAIALAEESK